MELDYEKEEFPEALSAAAYRVREYRNHRDSVKRRLDELIRQAHYAGWSMREIAEMTELSHQRVHQVVNG